MPRGSLPSTSMTCAYRPSSSASLNRTSAGRFSASTTARTSAPESSITRAVMWMATSSTVSVASSTQPIQSSRPPATTTASPLRGCRTNWPRFSRRRAQRGRGSRLSLSRLPAGVRTPAEDAHRLEVGDHRRLDLVGVGVELRELVEPLVGGQHRPAGGPRRQVHGLGPLEQVLDVERRESHSAYSPRQPPQCPSVTAVARTGENSGTRPNRYRTCVRGCVWSTVGRDGTQDTCEKDGAAPCPPCPASLERSPAAL